MIKIFKFGGAVLSEAGDLRQLPEVLRLYPGTDLVIVISAFAKITNTLEKFIQAKYEHKDAEAREILKEISEYHLKILHELWNDRSVPVYRETQRWFHQNRSPGHNIGRKKLSGSSPK